MQVYACTTFEAISAGWPAGFANLQSWLETGPYCPGSMGDRRRGGRPVPPGSVPDHRVVRDGPLALATAALAGRRVPTVGAMAGAGPSPAGPGARAGLSDGDQASEKLLPEASGHGLVGGLSATGTRAHGLVRSCGLRSPAWPAGGGVSS